MSVTPTVCMTLAFWLGRGRRIAGGCCAVTKGAAHAIAKRAARLKRESRFREFIVALLIEEFSALCNAPQVISKRSGREFTTFYNSNLLLGARTSRPHLSAWREETTFQAL